MGEMIDNERFRKLLLALPAKAIKLLYKNYYDGLVKLANAMTQDEDAAEDVVQETFTHVWENRFQLSRHHESSIHHYLIRVVKNKAITHFKKTKRLQEQLSKMHNGHVFESQLSTEAILIKQEVYERLRKVIDTFPRREKECLLMKIDQEMNPDEIATELKVTRKAVERSLTSANKRLRKYWNTPEKI